MDLLLRRRQMLYGTDLYTLTYTTTDAVQLTLSDSNIVSHTYDTDTRRGTVVYRTGTIRLTSFSNQTTLESINIPACITTLPSNAFGGTALTSIVIPDTVTSAGYGLFQNCTALASVTLSDSLTDIKNAAFENCRSLTQITLPATLTTIGVNAFRGTALTSIVIPDSVTTIDNSAFYQLSTLSGEVRLSASLQTLSNSAFAYSSVTALRITNTNAVVTLTQTNYPWTGTLYVPSALLSAYQSDSAWATWANLVGCSMVGY